MLLLDSVSVNWAGRSSITLNGGANIIVSCVSSVQDAPHVGFYRSLRILPTLCTSYGAERAFETVEQTGCLLYTSDAADD